MEELEDLLRTFAVKLVGASRYGQMDDEFPARTFKSVTQAYENLDLKVREVRGFVQTMCKISFATEGG